MARLTYNNQGGTLGASLTSSGTTITFAVAPNFATITGSDYIPICLDPGTASFEIVYLTAYTSGQTTGTIARAQEDSAHWPAVSHLSTGTWVTAPTILDGAYPFNTPSVIASASAQSYPNNTSTTMIFGTITAQRGGMSLATGTGLCTVPVNGIYLVSCSVWPASFTSGYLYALVAINGTTGGITLFSGSGSSSGLNVGGAQAVYLTAGQTVSVQLIQNSGSTMSLYGGQNFSCSLLSTP